MNKRLPPEDSQPWYRQFWPWFLILLPASVVVASLSTLFIANRHADDLVVDDYYKDGLAINRQLEKKQRAEELGVSATLTFYGNRVDVRLAGPVTTPSLKLLLSHPLESDRDFEVALRRIDSGHYGGTLRETIQPRWHWTLKGGGTDAWRLDGSVVAADIGDAAGE